MTIGLLMLAVGAAALSAIVASCAVYALPVFLGLTLGVVIYHAGAGALIAGTLSLIAATFTLAIGQAVFQTSRPLVRPVIGLTFALPAGYVGYSMASQVIPLITASSAWGLATAALIGLLTGIIAYMRVHSGVCGQVSAN